MRKTSNGQFKEYQAQEATRLRNEKLSGLDNYTIALKAIAEIALKNNHSYYSPGWCFTHSASVFVLISKVLA